jgi:hypothetical protein
LLPGDWNFFQARHASRDRAQATDSELVVNAKAAQALGLALAKTFLARADAVIE